MSKVMYAQGDVLLVAVDAIDFDPATRVNADGDMAVLQHGEHTDHMHFFKHGATMYHDGALARPSAKDSPYLGHVVVAEGGSQLEHGTAPGANDGDHDTIDVPAGTYIALGQQEVSDDELARPVSD